MKKETTIAAKLDQMVKKVSEIKGLLPWSGYGLVSYVKQNMIICRLNRATVVARGSNTNNFLSKGNASP